MTSIRSPEASKILLGEITKDFMIPGLHGVCWCSRLLEACYQTHITIYGLKFDEEELVPGMATINVEHECHYRTRHIQELPQ
jgi:hypothetical protein